MDVKKDLQKSIELIEDYIREPNSIEKEWLDCLILSKMALKTMLERYSKTNERDN